MVSHELVTNLFIQLRALNNIVTGTNQTCYSSHIFSDIDVNDDYVVAKDMIIIECFR